ncbi:hypothetical protein [Bradyrhizobium sp. RDI18]|uniref:hypothetical protein n=1 Tax=Bradyrhizobium sp. RDI18 TaxID=3367400 RepID=UPI00371A393F
MRAKSKKTDAFSSACGSLTESAYRCSDHGRVQVEFERAQTSRIQHLAERDTTVREYALLDPA